MNETTSVLIRSLRNPLLMIVVMVGLATFSERVLQGQQTSPATLQAARVKAARLQASSDPLRARIAAMDGCAWLEQDGIRAAWLGFKQIDDEMVRHLQDARVNTVFLKHGFHDLLDLQTARWDGDKIVVDPRKITLDRMIENTRRAAEHGIHVFWIANYELEQMQPHLQRLGYQTAFAEGPSRYLRPGPHRDAAPLDRVFWRGITGAHGALVATLSREHPIDGVLYDIEHYAGGIMYLQNSGFSDETFRTYLSSRQVNVPLEDVPAGKRYEYLKNSGRLHDYYHFLEEQACEQGSELANRWHAINPHLITGIWPLLDNWFSQGLLRGLGGAVPTLGLSGVEYYHGSAQSSRSHRRKSIEVSERRWWLADQFGLVGDDRRQGNQAASQKHPRQKFV